MLLVLLSLVLPSLRVTPVKIGLSGLVYVTGVTFLMGNTSEDQYIGSYVCHWCYCHWCSRVQGSLLFVTYTINVCNVCRVGEERKSVSLYCTPGVDSSNSLAKATVGEPEKDKIVLSLGRVNIPIFAGYSLSILTILVSILINFLL